MDTLRRSIAEEAKAGAASKTAAKTPATTAASNPKKGRKRVPGQGELLLPIAGRKAQPKEDTKPATQPTRGGKTLIESAAYPESISQASLTDSRPILSQVCRQPLSNQTSSAGAIQQQF